eukprot:3740936-Alexandrium_andersonii.AAC.1
MALGGETYMLRGCSLTKRSGLPPYAPTDPASARRCASLEISGTICGALCSWNYALIACHLLLSRFWK